MILPPVPDQRLVTIRRGGTLTDDDHHLLALWAAACAAHVLPLFEAARPDDARPREAAARDLTGAPRFAAYAAGQAAVVAHVAAHDLGAAAYAIKAARASMPASEAEAAGRAECRWQRAQLPSAVRELVLDDQRRRNELCWSVFDP